MYICQSVVSLSDNLTYSVACLQVKYGIHSLDISIATPLLYIFVIFKRKFNISLLKIAYFWNCFNDAIFRQAFTQTFIHDFGTVASVSSTENCVNRIFYLQTFRKITSSFGISNQYITTHSFLVLFLSTRIPLQTLFQYWFQFR